MIRLVTREELSIKIFQPAWHANRAGRPRSAPADDVRFNVVLR